MLDNQAFERLPRALGSATKVRALSMTLCYDMALTKADVDQTLMRMTALEQLKISKMESWSEWGAPVL